MMKLFNEYCEVPEPVLLNCWKHHTGFIKTKISEYKGHPETSAEFLRKQILCIGGSLMDLYLGSLSASEIAASIINHVQRQGILNKENYRIWLHEGEKDYREIEIADGSRWTLLLGENAERFIHIHPSRYSPHTIRVRASSLKSAILFCGLERGEQRETLSTLNKIRNEYLNLPPLKNINPASMFMNLVKTFNRSEPISFQKKVFPFLKKPLKGFL